jgi:hypothetical protein
MKKAMQSEQSRVSEYFPRWRSSGQNLFSLAVILLMLGFTTVLRAASFTASLDNNTIILGEKAVLTLTFDGQPNNVPVPKALGLYFGGPSTRSSQNIDLNSGQVNSTISISYQVAAQGTGEFTIPALTADVNGRSVTTEPLKLIVTKASAPSSAAVNSGNEPAFLKFVFSGSKMYVGESVLGRLELYLRDDVSGLNGFQMASLPADGFSSGKTVELQNQRRRVQVGNRVYTVIPLSLPLTAIRTGDLTLGPFTATVVVVLPAQNQGNDPIFRFFNQGEQKQMTLATGPVIVKSLPLPSENQPANFTGAVGDFTMTATAGPTTLTVGDPITVRVQISGRGALDAITLPTQDSWHDFKMYPATTKVEPSDQFGFQGTKTFEQIISPQNSDVHELPPFTFSFFNPADGQYHTLTQPAVPLIVKAAGTSPMPALAANKNSAPENQLPQDILPIKENLGKLITKSAPLIAQPAFIAVQAVPVLAFVAAFIWRKRADNLANNPRLRRQRAVAQLVRAGVNDLKNFAAQNQPDEFFALLFRLLQEQLGERLDCPASAITENVIEDHAVLRTASTPTLEGLRELFQLCNQARYAPVRGTGELNSVAAKFEKTIRELQEVKA